MKHTCICTNNIMNERHPFGCLFCMQKIKYQAVDACAIDDIMAIIKEKQRLFSHMAWIYTSEDAGYHSPQVGKKRNNLLPVKMLVT